MAGWLATWALNNRIHNQSPRLARDQDIEH
jgi:hypothetical protein